MKPLEIINRMRRSLMPLACAVAVAAGLSAGSAQALTTTTVIDLGVFPAYTRVDSGTLYSRIALDALPTGSILRTVSWDVRLGNGDPYLGDLAVYFADRAGVGVLQVGAFGADVDGGTLVAADAPIKLPWNAGADYSIGAAASKTLTAADGVPAIDLHDHSVSLETVYSGGWSGTITLEYDIGALSVALTSPPNAQAYETGTPITATATVLEPGAFTDTVTFHTTPISPSGPTVATVSTGTSSPFSASLGALPSGTYQIYATVANTDAPPGTATSATRTFTVAAATPTTTVLAAAGAPTTYGESVTFTATVSPVPTGGTVQFLDGDGYVGSPVAVNTTTGEATLNTTALGAGTRVITAEYSGFQIYLTSTAAASISQVVGKAPLTVKASDMLRAPNTPNPSPFLYQTSGYQNGQTLATSGVTGTPGLTTTAVPASPAGDYPITCALGTLDSPNYSFTLVDATLTVKELTDTFSLNFYSFGSLPPASQANVLMSPTLPAGFDDWETIGWSNFEVPWNPSSPLAPVTLTSNKSSTATFTLKDCRNGWQSFGEPRNTNLGDGTYNMMGSGVNSTLNFSVSPGDHLFDMEMTNIPFAVYDVIFYIRANDSQFGDGTGIIKFKGGADRAFKLKSGAFDGNFIEMVDATTEGNYIVFKNVTGSSFTAQTWGTGSNGYNHLGPAGFQVREVAATTGFSAWATANAPGQTADQDHDNDGVKNGIEYFMGQSGSSFTAMPGLDATNTVTWAMDPAYVGTYEVQTSSNLGTWTNVTPRPVPAGGNLSYLLPPGLGIQFVRLLVTPTP
jgi:hypothetical protein